MEFNNNHPQDQQYIEATDVPDSSIKSLRPYRSRRTRPCDRCRSRKQRCVITHPDAPCIHCDLAKRTCTFNSPPLETISRLRKEKQRAEKLAAMEKIQVEQKMEGSGPPSMSVPGIYPLNGNGSGLSSMQSGINLNGSMPIGNNGGSGGVYQGLPMTGNQAYNFANNISNNIAQLASFATSMRPPNQLPQIHSYHSSNAGPGPSTMAMAMEPQHHPPNSSQMLYDRAPPTSTSASAGTPKTPGAAKLLENIARANSASNYFLHAFRGSSPDEPSQPHPALDDEADDNEELYLIGMATEYDALLLNSMALSGADAAGERGNSPNEVVRAGPGTGHAFNLHAKAGSGAGPRVRYVSTDTYSQTAFIFHRSSISIYPEPVSLAQPLRDMEQLVGRDAVSLALHNYMRYDGLAYPISRTQHFDGTIPMHELLECCYIASGLIYDPPNRHLQKPAWNIIVDYCRRHPPRARLWQIQFYLIDLNGRTNLSPAENFVNMGIMYSVAKLLGLHRDCSTWSIPVWERDLRIRMWWSIVIYDITSALSFGRASIICHSDVTVPLPAFSPLDTPSYTSFLALCRLTFIMTSIAELLLKIHTIDPSQNQTQARKANLELKLNEMAFIGAALDRWRNTAEIDRLFGQDSGAPGARSLALLYHMCVISLVRSAWDITASESEEVIEESQRACLTAIDGMVDFLAMLNGDDLIGYWASHCSYALSAILTILVKLILQSDRSDQSDSAIWQRALFALRRFISTLRNAKTNWGWDVADLTLARAGLYMPILGQQVPEFGVVMEPFPVPTEEQDILDFEMLLNTFM